MPQDNRNANLSGIHRQWIPIFVQQNVIFLILLHKTNMSVTIAATVTLMLTQLFTSISSMYERHDISKNGRKHCDDRYKCFLMKQRIAAFVHFQ